MIVFRLKHRRNVGGNFRRCPARGAGREVRDT